MSLKTRRFLVLVAVLCVSAVGLVYQSATIGASSLPEGISTRVQRQAYLRTLSGVIPEIRQISDAQTTQHLTVVNESEMQDKIASIRLHIMRSNFPEAQKEIRALRSDVARWKDSVNKAAASQKVSRAVDEAAAKANKVIPILTYHYTPGDFESQLVYLRDHGYTTITMTDVSDALLRGSALPPKPVVITFDDGYTDQLKAFSLLQKYQMKATFYIITGGEASKWCIGADRRYDQGYSCGDQYLSWDAVRMLDQSGLIEIGGHTVNHLALASQPAATQMSEVSQNKATIEAHLGHPIYHFAYPYGSHNSSAVEAVRAAGYVTAVTTLPGTVQTGVKVLSLYRITSVRTLP